MDKRFLVFYMRGDCITCLAFNEIQDAFRCAEITIEREKRDGDVFLLSLAEMAVKHNNLAVIGAINSLFRREILIKYLKSHPQWGPGENIKATWGIEASGGIEADRENFVKVEKC